uniref:Uncharacterized protein n=1 Tax=Octopus bimaculoides TaxID=37653 RepID=A0A0L8GEN0_OCTBM
MYTCMYLDLLWSFAISVVRLNIVRRQFPFLSPSSSVLPGGSLTHMSTPSQSYLLHTTPDFLSHLFLFFCFFPPSAHSNCYSLHVQ